MTRRVFLAWQDPRSRHWCPVGRLTSDGKLFTFVYTQGAMEAQAAGTFSPLTAFPDLRKEYQSERLFPLFQNRLLPESRPDYDDFLKWLSLSKEAATPLVVLARSGGRRATDNLEVFACPERLPDATYETHFFVHGLSHMPKASLLKSESLVVGERLLIAKDIQNPLDPNAMLLRTEGEPVVIGFCPRYLCGELQDLMHLGESEPMVTIERINPRPAPAQLRVLCRLRAQWPAGFVPFGRKEFQPISRSSARVRHVA